MKLIPHNFLGAFVISILMLSINYAQNLNLTEIIGNWESVSSENSHVESIRFDLDSTFYIQSVLSAEYSYSIVGNKMIAKLLNSKKIFIDTTDIVIKKDTLISILRRNGNEEITTMVRIPGEISDSAGIAGNYKWKYPNAHTAFSKFTKDGVWLFRLPIETYYGKYKISSDSIIFSYTGLPAHIMKFWLDSKVLILTDNNTGKETLYRKVDYFVKEDK
jgi:hypothetical protein